MVRRSGLLFERGLGAPLSPAREFALSQTVFVGSLAGAVGAFVLAQRWARPDRRADRWLVAPAFGLLAGWVTAAFFVGFVTVLVATGVLGGGPGEAVLGALMLVAGRCRRLRGHTGWAERPSTGLPGVRGGRSLGPCGGVRQPVPGVPDHGVHGRRLRGHTGRDSPLLRTARRTSGPQRPPDGASRNGLRGGISGSRTVWVS
jgi:hypothetical protein